MRWLTWIGITALSSAIFVGAAVTGCAEGDASFDPAGATGTGAGGGAQQGSGGMTTSTSQGAGSSTGGNGTGATGGTGSTGGNGGAGGTPPTGLTYTGTILDGFTQNPIPAADVCAIDPMLPCVVTDAVGAFTYPGVPENTRVRVGAMKAQYFPVASLIDTTTTNGTLTAFMLSTGIIDLALTVIPGVTFNQMLPAISVTVRDLADNPLPGYTVSLSDPTAGDGPYYIDGTSIVLGAMATQSTGTAFFVNVPIGTYDVSVSGPAVCNASYITDNVNTHTAPLINAAQFVIVFDCQ